MNFLLKPVNCWFNIFVSLTGDNFLLTFLEMTPVSKLYLCNFSTTNIYELFFTMFALQEQFSFIFALLFLNCFNMVAWLKIVIFSQLPDNEVICICCKCKQELRCSVILKGELSDSYFNELKKC